jgi:hypothetical protein
MVLKASQPLLVYVILKPCFHYAFFLYQNKSYMVNTTVTTVLSSLIL